MPSEPSSRRRGRGRGSPANPQPAQRRGRGPPANPQPAQRRATRSAANPALRGLADDKLRAGYSTVVHFDVPIAGGREIISIDRRGQRPESGRMPGGGLTVFVALGRDGRYSTDSLRGRFDTVDELLHAFGACWPSPCATRPPSEEQKRDAPPDTRSYPPMSAPQAGSYPLYASTSAQLSTAAQGRSYAPMSATHDWPYAPVFTPSSAPVFAPKSEHAPPPTPYAHFSKMIDKYLPDCPPAYTSYSPTCMEEDMSQPPLAHTVQKLDVLSLEDSNNGPPGCRLSWSPIWDRSVFDWGITFYTTRDRTGSFRTYPDVGGPFQSLDEVNSAIDQYLIDHEDLTMCAGLSQVDSIVKRVRYYPDGTKKRGSEVKDKRRDKYYQLARALVDKYNDHHNLFGDLAYEVKDFLHGKPLWEDYYIHWTYFHMNFTAKAKGSYGVDTGNLFFAEVKYTRGDDGLTVNSCCILEPSDHGLCYGCGAGMKHPNDGNAYACGRRNISYRFQNGAPELPPGYCNDRYYEDSDEEVERLRSQFKEDEGGLKPVPMPLVV